MFGMEGSSKIRQRTIHGKLFESFTNEVTYPWLNSDIQGIYKGKEHRKLVKNK